MRLVTFASITSPSIERLGLLTGDTVLDLSVASGGDPRFTSMLSLVEGGKNALKDLDGISIGVSPKGMGPGRTLYDRASVRIAAPIPRPRKNVFCVGLNFRSHVEQNASALGLPMAIPNVPLFFSKPPTAVVGSDEGIILDRRLTTKLDYEVELAVVIGKRGSWIQKDEVGEYIFGYTLLNDVSARDLQWRTTQMFYGKGLDTFCPIGPCIATADEVGAVEDVVLDLRVNGELRQHESVGNMIFSVGAVIAELSRGLTLEPGDVISLGTPGGCGYQMVPPRFLDVGDVVECSASRIGTLRNTIISSTEP